MIDHIRIVKDESGKVYLNQEDLVEIMKDRLGRFPLEIENLKKPQQSTIIGLDGNPKITPSDPAEVARHEGMQTMLEGILGMVSVQQ